MTIEEKKEKASKTLATMLDYLGLEAALRAEDRDDRIAITVTSDDAGRIIGRKGQSLESLQLLLNRMMLKCDMEFPRVMIDIDGYSQKSDDRRPFRGRDNRRDDRRRDDRRDRRDDRDSRPSRIDEETLRQQAMDAAKEVKRWGEPVSLPPMNAKERRIVHITLQNDDELKTESEGEGQRKKVIISLK